MKHKTHMIVFIVFIAGVSPFLSVFASADDEATVNIHMIEETTRTRFDNPVMVAGLWHYINVTLETQDFQELTLKFYQGDSMPSEANRDETNYYEWKYDANSQQWTDVNKYEGYTYIKNESCQKDGNTYSFCVGIKDTFPSTLDYYENWTLEVYKDEDKLRSETVVVEKPSPGLAKTHGDLIQFYVAPFKEMDALGDDFLRIENTGNIPLYITISYGTYYSNIVEFSGFNTIISPYSTSAHTPIVVHSESWKPEVKEVAGDVSGRVPGSYIISHGYILEPSLAINAPDLKIYVGHGNYEIYEFLTSDITFQYEKTLEMSEDEIRSIPVYISGSGTLTFDVKSNENLNILKVFDDQNAEVVAPLDITSTNTSEYNVTVRVKALRENTTGFLYYNLTIGNETQTFITQISIGPPASPAEETITLDIQIIIAILVIIVIIMVYIIYTQMKYRRR